MIAVVEIGGKQYKVQKGDAVTVDNVDGNVGDTVKLTRVLLTSSDGKTTVGTPHVKGVVVTAKIIKQGKGEKVDVYRYKSKVRHRRHIGFRPRETSFEIMSVGRP